MSKYGPNIEVVNEGEITIVKLKDKEILEESVIHNISESIFSVVAENPGIKLVLDFSQVKHFSSSALGMLIRINKRVEEMGGTLKLCQIRANLYEIFIITNLNKIFEIYPEKQQALSSF